MIRSPLNPQQIRLLIAFALPLLIAVVLAGCGEQPSGASPAGSAPAAVVHVTATANPAKLVPDPPEGAEATAYARDATPQFIANMPAGRDKDRATRRYAFAATHMDVLAQMPCYCGCAIYQHMHTSLKSCFIRSVAADGKIVYTDHSITCDICTGEVDMVENLVAGTPLKLLRDQIHAKYSYTGVWTDTPPIQ